MMVATRLMVLGVAVLIVGPLPATALLLTPLSRAALTAPSPLRVAAAAVCAEGAPDAAPTAEEQEIITLTDAAIEQLVTLRQKQGLDQIFLRMGVRAGGQ